MASKGNPSASDTAGPPKRRWQGPTIIRDLLQGQPPAPVDVKGLLEQYGCGAIPLTGTGDALYERHLFFDNAIAPPNATPRERF